MGRRSLGISAAGTVFAIFGVLPALAQPASQVTPDFRPIPQPRQVLVFSGEPGLNAPAGAENLTVQLSRVTVEGTKPELEAATSELTASLVGHRVSVADIFARARDLEAAYSNAGYTLVRVVVPAQQLNDGGTLRLTVVEGFIERVDATNLPEPVRSRVEALVDPLIDRPGVTQAEIERALILAGNTPGVGLRTALASGEKPGGAVLIVEGEFESIRSFVSIDNTLSDDLGTWALGVGVDFNSLFGAGEVIYLRAVANPDFTGDGDVGSPFSEDPRYRSLAAGLQAPIGTSGLKVNLEGVLTQTAPDPFFGLQTSSSFDRISMGVEYPVLLTREASLNTGLTFDVENDSNSLIDPDFDLYQDNLRVLRLEGNGSWSSPVGLLTGGATLSLGLDVMGARSAADAAASSVPLSRQGADDVFQKLEVDFGYSYSPAPNFALSVDARAQTSFGQPLLNAEQFGIADLEDLSTFDSGSLVGDSGWVVRAEASTPFDVPLETNNLAVAPYLFGAVGRLILEDPTILESAVTDAASLGLGVRLGASGDDSNVASTVRLEYGLALLDNEFGSSDGDRFTVVASAKF